MLFKNKRGKTPDAMAAAVLIAIITGLIVLYILVLPPEDRQELLDLDDDGTSSSKDEANILLSESPQRITPPA